MDDLNFAQILCSKLCHDLITPVGAINSGLEILQESEDPDDRQQLLELTQQSAETAARRLTFYRVAYGYSGAAMASKYLSVKQLIEYFLTPLKIRLSWLSCESCNQDAALLKDINLWSKVIMNVVLIATEGLPQGGEILLEHHRQEKEVKFVFQVQGNFKGLRPDTVSILTQKTDSKELTPYTIQAILLMKLVEKLSATLKILDLNNEALKLEVSQQI